MENLPKTNENQAGTASESRLVPFTVAGIVCFALAFLMGAGSWYFLGTNRRLAPEKDLIAVQTSNQNTSVENSNLANLSAPANIPVTAPPEVKKAPAGEIAVSGGEVTLGGGDSKLPVRRVLVEPFSIGETEVTNAQYAEFIEDTKRRAPNGWLDGKMPPERADEPVVGITWADANDYCEWLSKKLSATVRLPTEAEWELAARGSTGNKYPWGNDWNDEALESGEANRKIRPVRSYPKGRSPGGAYDLVGNVWEWTADLFVDELGNPDLYENTKQRVIKGGSVYDKRKYLTIDGHLPRPENKPSDYLGFRYVIIRK